MSNHAPLEQVERAAFDAWFPLGCPVAGVAAQMAALAGFRAGAEWQRARHAEADGVERYDWTYDEMAESQDGNYVRHGDYDAVTAERDRLREENEQLKAKPAQALTEALGERLMQSSAENYIETTFGVDGTDEDIVVTLRRSAGKTPHELRLEAEAVEIVASAIDGPCREVESIDDMAQIICGQLGEAGFLRVRKSEAANFAAPIADVLCRFGLSRDDAEALGAELAIALIPHLAQWDEDHHAAPIAQTAPQPEQSRLVEALQLAANRLDRLGLNQPPHTKEYHEARDWAEEAFSVLRDCRAPAAKQEAPNA